MVGTLKPSIEMLSLPLLPFAPLCSLHSSLLPFAPFTPLCSLNSLDPSLTLPTGVGTIQPSIEILPIGPHLLPFTKILALWWGPTKPFCCYVNGDWVGIVLPGGGDT